VPSFTTEARPVLGHYAWHWLARIHAYRHRGHITIVRHRPTTAGLSVLTRERHFLIDPARQTAHTQVPLPPASGQNRALTLTLEWWISDSHLLLSAAPGDARQQLSYHVTRTIHHLLHTVPDNELLAIRRHLEDTLRGATTTTTGLTWRMTSIRADARTTPRPWRNELDTWLHQQLDETPDLR
jgi:hypothetical protein